MASTSFYHAIYKRLRAVARAANAHMDDGSMDGGFTLRSPGDMHGIFGKIMPGPGGALANQSPLGNNVADNNPIYRILLKSLDANPQLSTQVNGQTWPVMPFPVGNPPSIASYPFWVNANKANNPPRLIDKLKEWIEQNNKTDDTPGGGNLDFAHWGPGPAAFPVKDKQALLVCSIDKDNGVRPGNVPANYWNTSQIFVCDDKGKNQGLPVFKAGAQHTIQAIIGNSGNLTAGVLFNLPPLQVRANAYVWNTFLSPSFPLPALSALDANNAGPTYEQPGLVAQSYAVASASTSTWCSRACTTPWWRQASRRSSSAALRSTSG